MRANAIRTKVEDYPWAELDLGKEVSISDLHLVVGAGRFPMRNAFVSVSDSPTPVGFDPLAYYPRIQSIHVPGVLKGELTVPLRARGRFVRLIVPGTSAISLDRFAIYQ